MKRKIFMILALLCAFAQGAWAQNEWDEVYALTQTTSANWAALGSGSTTGKTLGSAGATTYYYATSDLSFTNSNDGGSGLTILGTVYLYIPSGVTVTCTGHNASGTTGAGAGVELAAGNTLYLLGGGTINATGGNAANGTNGSNGDNSNFVYNDYCQPGSGGAGGNGGGGAGAGIGTRGGNGGNGGAGGAANRNSDEGTNYGVAGSAGSAGATAGSMGTLYVNLSISVNVTGGSAGTGGTGGNRGYNAAEDPGHQYSASGGGGGGAGGGGGFANNIGTGGPGGGGGGGGAAGNSAWRDSYELEFFRVGAGGGSGGQNADGTYAANGVTSELTNPYDAEYQGGLDHYYYSMNRYEEGNGQASGGGSGSCGGASQSGSAINLVYWPTQGAGTVESPYRISSVNEWNTFVTNVSNGNSYSGQYVKLTNDISVSNMAGGYQADDNYQPFSGTFDGDGHTLTLNVNNQSRFAAPFKCVSGATIKNLRTAGTIDGTGNADGKLLAGIIGVSFGNTTITGCRSSVTLTTGFGEDAAMAGLVAGTKGGNLTIEGCVFDGSMTGSSNTRCAGIAGYEYGGTTTVIRNSLFAPTTLTISTADDSYTKTFSRDPDATITNCYYTQTLGTAQGTQAVASTTVLSELGSLVQDYGWVKVFQNGLLSDDKAYVTPGTNSTCTGTAEDPYIISNNDQWTILAAYVNGGNSYSGKFVSLDADIDVSAMVGHHVSDNDNKPFSGTFLGNGHTITVTLTDDGKQGLAPFRYIDGATIKNLKVAGTIASSQYHSAGVVGFASGADTIEGCVVTATLNISSDYAGGIIGHGLTSATTIRGCAFTGTVNGVDGNRSNIGGIWGWSSDATPTLVNCLEAGTYTNIASMHPMGLQSASGTITNCYYVNPQTGSPRNVCTVSGAKQAYTAATTPANLGSLVEDYGMVKAYANGILVGGTYYGGPATGTAGDPYTISNSDEWTNFAYNVNSGNNYNGKYVRLTQDISISTPVGSHVSDSDNKPFSGTFLGDGHTITVTLTDDGKQGLAPFRYIDGATIKNLKVAGTIASSQYHSAGVVGFASGANTIEGCVVTATLNISSDYAGGIIGHGLTSATTIRGCAFTGTVNGVDGNRSNIGGIWGWSSDATPTLVNCLEAGTYTNIASMHPMGLQSASGTITNCYYVNPQVGEPRNACTVSGAKQAYAAATTPANLGSLVEDYGMVKAYANGILVGGTYYGVPATGTAGDPYTISNSDEWTNFAYNVNSGNNYNGKYVKLTQDISISTPVGSRVSDSDNKPFSGTFLGNGHTITAALENDDNQGLAPFRCINGATIRDLKVAGTIASNQNHASGLVGFANGTNLIENCIVTATLNISSNYAGGIIGHGLNSNTTIRGCVFAGTINGVDGDRENIGGIWGWSNSGTPTLEDCLEAGTYTNIASMHPMGLQKAAGTITNCYYVTPQIGNPTNACTVSGAIQALTDAEILPVGNPTATYNVSGITVYVNGINHDGIFYYHPDRNVKITGLKWYAIATPMHDDGQDNESIVNVANLTTDNYDLLRYDETTGTWENQKEGNDATGFTTLEPGRGYIYRCSDARTLTYTGVPNNEESYSVSLTASSAAGDLKGFNLVGNPYPFSVTMYRPFYSLGADGIWQAHASGESLEAGQGALVYATSNEPLTFYAATRSTNPGMDALPALPKALCLGGNGDDPSNHAISQSVNLPFAHQDGNSIVVTGTGTLQAYDIMGRLLFRMELNTDAMTHLHINAFPSAGVYLLRLGSQSQKIVIR